MKKIIVTYINRKDTTKVYTLVSADEQNNHAILTDAEGAHRSMKLTTLKKTFKRVEQEIEVEEPKAEEKPMTKHQEDALKNLRGAYNFVVGGYENSVQDGDMEEMPAVEDLFDEVYGEAMSTRYGMVGGLSISGGDAPICMKFAGKAFIREQLVKMLRADGYEVSEDLVKVLNKKQGHSNLVDGERINLRRDEGERLVNVRAFTGMLIGTFKVEKETKTTITVKTAKGKLKFDKETGVQLDAANPKYANRIEIC